MPSLDTRDYTQTRALDSHSRCTHTYSRTHPPRVSMDPHPFPQHPHTHSGPLQYQEAGRRGDGGSPELTCRSPAETQGNSWHRSPLCLGSGSQDRGDLRFPGWGRCGQLGGAGPALGSALTPVALGMPDRHPGRPSLGEFSGRFMGRRGRASRAPPLRVPAARGQAALFPGSVSSSQGNGLWGLLDSSGL